ncbi:MAG: ketol-acid reductoisomerase [Thaumarchaeota archaeon]|nr:ketol-acid reductoisomerase [Nitrososphaerota archaeon]
MAETWYDKDVSPEGLAGQTVAVIGYGIQGAAQASNLKDSGFNVIVGLRKDGKSWREAAGDGHRVMEIEDAVEKGDVIHLLIPDMEQANLYRNQIETHLSEGKALSFSHGAAIHWKWIVPPNKVDVIMLAPKAPGRRVRELFKEDFGTPALVAVEQDFSKKAWPRVLAMAKGVGCTRAGVLKTTFKEEVETDWFGEQVDLCGGVVALIRTSFETLVEYGYQPEIAYFECLHELKLIVDLVQKYGISGMYSRVSETARYGGLTRGDRVVGGDSRVAMKNILEEIRSGGFAKEWVSTYEKEGKRSFERHLDEIRQHPIEVVGKRLRQMMWPGEEVE